MKKISRRTLRLNEEYEEYLNKIKESFPLYSENSLICLALKNYHDNVLNGKYSNRRKIEDAKMKYSEFVEKDENKAKNNDFLNNNKVKDITIASLNESMEDELVEWKRMQEEMKKAKR